MTTRPPWPPHIAIPDAGSVSLHPLWRSPFRPFFLLGALFGPALLLSWFPLHLGTLPALYHQHEMVFGFATAIIFGFLLTALPSWAGTSELTGARLRLLVLCWLGGRLAVATTSLLPLPLVAAIDLGFPVLFALLVGPGLRTVKLPIIAGLALITTGFFAGNLCYYLGIMEQDQALSLQGLRLGLYAMIFHCSVTVGVLAPIFTENALQERGQARDIGHSLALEWLSALSILALAVADTAGAEPFTNGILAFVCLLLHCLRLGRWQSLEIIDTPIVWVLHFGYAWLCVSLLLYALQGFGLAVGTESWVHAFTVGGFGLMSLGLMTRVSLRHTGREMRPGPAMVGAYLCLAAAALVRIAISLTPARPELLLLSTLLWVIPYLLYLALYGRMLLTPSLPDNSQSVHAT